MTFPGLLSRLLPGVAAALLAVPASAEPTPVTVRVLSQGGKYVGSSMGGAMVRITDAATGRLLAEGPTSGGTGDTGRIMGPQPRGAVLADERTAAFRATLDLDRPQLVQISAYGPASDPQSAVSVAVTRWLVPGPAATLGDGIVLELPGLVVRPSPPASAEADGSARIAAQVMLMCGCPIEPGGLWDSARFDVTAVLVDADGREQARHRLDYAGQTGLFAARIPAAALAGRAVRIIAIDTRTGAVGVATAPPGG